MVQPHGQGRGAGARRSRRRRAAAARNERGQDQQPGRFHNDTPPCVSLMAASIEVRRSRVLTRAAATDTSAAP